MFKFKNIKLLITSFVIVSLFYPNTYKLIYDNIDKTRIILSINKTDLKVIDSKTNKSKIAILFSGGYKTIYDKAFPIIENNNLIANVGFIPSLENEDGYMNYSELSSLYIKGWNILNQTYSHEKNMYFKCDELISDIIKAKKYMDTHYLDFASDSVIIPYGEVNPYLIKLLKENNFCSIKTSDNIILMDGEIEYCHLKVININNSTTVEQFEEFISRCKKNNYFCIVMFDRLDDNNYNRNSNYCSIEKFKRIIDTILKHNNEYEVVTYNNLISKKN
ncbi:polysaccharide deacetylase family protein [Sedimentibacter sp. zth1]|uniref:polysaccharide deacetylase family protein n=1 Tax=Sedimentibacter sp. zth1 TaxID=2816908 RepID=UPI001A927F35|nr:polysaccharide deacetylase family protein [Sedimentibacter sp. zth1]QSX05773.1 polysaccharide deacetylase family protein [Sedimentibacter sp. zth1]